MGRIVSFTGRSGSGKSKRAALLVERVPLARRIVSYTTRPPRPDDASGEYACVSKDEFEAMAVREAFLWAPYYGSSRYGTKREDIAAALRTPGIHVITLVPEVVPALRNYLASRGALDSYVPFYVRNPGEEVIRERLARRQSFGAAEVAARMEAEKAWDGDAVASGIGYAFISNSPVLEDAYAEIATRLGL